MPESLMGDLRAQISACTTGEKGMISLVNKYGGDSFREHCEVLHNYAEKIMRKQIAKPYLDDFCDECKADLDNLEDKECFYNGAKVSFQCKGCLHSNYHSDECRLQKGYANMKNADKERRRAFYQIA